MKKSLLIMLAVLLTGVFSGLFGAIPPAERAALIALYNSTNGDGVLDIL